MDPARSDGNLYLGHFHPDLIGLSAPRCHMSPGRDETKGLDRQTDIVWPGHAGGSLLSPARVPDPSGVRQRAAAASFSTHERKKWD